MIHNVADGLQAFLVPIDQVRPHPRNKRQGDVGAMCLRLEHDGQYRLAVVQRSTGYICAGSHMWKAAKALGWTHLAVLYKDMDDTAALQLMVGDNRQADQGSYDQDGLEELLTELATKGALDGTGYTGDDLDDLRMSNKATHDAPNWDTPADAETAPLPSTEKREPANVMQVSVGPELWEDFSAAVRKLRKAHQVETASQAVVAVIIDAASRLGGDR